MKKLPDPSSNSLLVSQALKVVDNCLHLIILEVLERRHFVSTVDNLLLNFFCGGRPAGRQLGIFKQPCQPWPHFWILAIMKMADRTVGFKKFLARERRFGVLELGKHPVTCSVRVSEGAFEKFCFILTIQLELGRTFLALKAESERYPVAGLRHLFYDQTTLELLTGQSSRCCLRKLVDFIKVGLPDTGLPLIGNLSNLNIPFNPGPILLAVLSVRWQAEQFCLKTMAPSAAGPSVTDASGALVP